MGDLMLFLLSALAAGLVGYNISSSPMIVELYEAGARAGLREAASSMIVGVWIPGIAESIYFDVMPVALMAAVYFVGVDREQGYALLHLLAGGSRRGYYVQRILLAPLALLSVVGLSALTGLMVVDSYIVTGAPALAGLIALTILAVVGFQAVAGVLVVLSIGRVFPSFVVGLALLYTAGVAGVWRILLRDNVWEATGVVAAIVAVLWLLSRVAAARSPLRL